MGVICRPYRGLSATILQDVPGYGLYFFGVRLVPFFSPFPVILTSHHTPQKYEGTLCLFMPSNPAHHAGPALVLDQVADTLSCANPRRVRPAGLWHCTLTRLASSLWLL